MGNVSSAHRAPLMDAHFTPVSDASVNTRGMLSDQIDRVLPMVDRSALQPLDAVLATKLGGYKSAPQMPSFDTMPDPAEDLTAFTVFLRAQILAAVMGRDRDGLISALMAVKHFKERMIDLSEGDLFENGADLWRLLLDLYRRTGQSFLLDVMSELRSRLTDVSGVMHSFPFESPYVAPSQADMDRNPGYYERIRRLATTRLMADSLAMTALISQYSGDRRDMESAQMGLDHLKRRHILPGGAVSGDPYLAGNGPTQAAELTSVCAQAEAYLDALLTTGGCDFAEQLEMLFLNVLPDLIAANGVCPVSVPNRLPGDESCAVEQPAQNEVSALLRCLYAIRRSMWLLQDDRTVCCAQPLDGICTVRVSGSTVRLTSEIKETAAMRVQTLHIDTAAPLSFTLSLRVPTYARSASLRVNGEEVQPVFQKGYASVTRNFVGGDVVTLEVQSEVRKVTGWRDSVSLYLGSRLMALPIPADNTEWRFALRLSDEPRADGDTVLAVACAAPQWAVQEGIVGAPPRDVKNGPAYELSLRPAAGLKGRITAFPRVTER